MVCIGCKPQVAAHVTRMDDVSFEDAIAPKWAPYGKSNSECSLPAGLFNGFYPCLLLDNCSDLNSELQRVLTGLESVVCGRKKSSCSLSVAEVDRHIEQLTTASEHCDLAIKVGLLLPSLGFLRGWKGEGKLFLA